MESRVLRAQNVSRMCLVCGLENRFGLKARFFELESGELACVFTPGEEQQSYPGRLHGGITSAILDETIGRAVNMLHDDAWGVTVDLNVRFRAPVPLGRPLVAIGRITRDGRLFEGSGEIVLEDGTVAAEASGRYMRLPIDRIAEGDFHREWFPDTRPLPEAVRIENPST